MRLVPFSLEKGTSPIITIAIIVRDPSNNSQETAGRQSPKKLQQPVKQVMKTSMYSESFFFSHVWPKNAWVNWCENVQIFVDGMKIIGNVYCLCLDNLMLKGTWSIFFNQLSLRFSLYFNNNNIINRWHVCMPRHMRVNQT